MINQNLDFFSISDSIQIGQNLGLNGFLALSDITYSHFWLNWSNGWVGIEILQESNKNYPQF